MPVIASTYTTDAYTQADGRRYVHEAHTTSDGMVQNVTYLAPANWTATEYAATMNARVAQIDAELAQAEFQQLLGEEV